MKIVALEEHFVTPELVRAWEGLSGTERHDALDQMTMPDIHDRLLEIGDKRIAAMDAGGVTMQVLSLTTPGPQNLGPEEAVRLAADANDKLAAAIARHPDRFGGFAALATPAPDQAARELERAVRELGLDGAMLNGRTGDRNIDDPALEPIWAKAAALRAPIYIHPQLPVTLVRDAYYAGLGQGVEAVFMQAAIGWHYETGVQLLRLILAGTFDRYPELQVIVGHWGEVVLFYLDRLQTLDKVAGLKRPLADYFRANVYVTPSGIFSQRYFAWSREVLGIDRVLFATDYPYVPESKAGARAFLDAAPLTQDERQAVAHGNWDRLRAAIRR